MANSYRNKIDAKKKRGQPSFDKSKARNTEKLIPCNICGTKSRPKVLTAGVCPRCMVL